MGTQSQVLADELARAIGRVHDPTTSAEDRRNALKFCEEFKGRSEPPFACGLILSSTCYDGPTRHFGLQLIEQCVRRQWNSLSVADKVNVKDSAMCLAAEATGDAVFQQPYYKDALSRVIVEMIKREWPQQWPTLWSELGELCKLGTAQTELVMYILLRLMEDVITFQNVPPQRRKDIQHTLTNSLPDILCFLLDTLVSAVSAYQQAVPGTVCADSYLRLARTALQTASGYVEWAPVMHLTAAGRDDKGVEHLVQLLRQLLCMTELRAAAAECLLALAGRRGGKFEDRLPLLALFEDEALSAVIDSAAAAMSTAPTDDDSYTFLKILCQVVVAMGTQICFIWGAQPTYPEPAAFDKFLSALLFFTDHPSQLLNEMSFSFWPVLLRSSGVAIRAALTDGTVELILSSAKHKLGRISYLTHDENHPSCHYSRKDFDSDDVFSVFFSRLRSGIAETIRLCSSLHPVMTFRTMTSFLDDVMLRPVDHGAFKLIEHSFSSIEWDSVAAFLESAIPKLMTSDLMRGSVEFKHAGVSLLRRALAYETQDPVIMSSHLTCISALFPFVKEDTAVLPMVLEKMFAVVHFEVEGQTKSTRSRAVVSARRHACSAIVRICKLHPQLLLSIFSDLHSYIMKISEDEAFSAAEICVLKEPLIIISNELNDFQKQSAYVGELMSSVPDYLAGAYFMSCLDSESSFFAFIGLDKSAAEQDMDVVCNTNRAKIFYCINTILAIVRRARCPSDPALLASGGFLDNNAGVGAGTSAPLKHPAASHILPLVPYMLRLVQVLGGRLLHPDVRPLWYNRDDSAFIVDIPEGEKCVLLGAHSLHATRDNAAPASKTPSERMQSFVFSAYDSCLYVLGACCQNLGRHFYATLDISQLISCTCCDLGYLPDIKLRALLRIFTKPFALHCPPELADLLVLPVLDSILPHAFQTLNRRWDIVNQQAKTCLTGDDEEMERREIIEEQLLRCLSREYLDLLHALLLHQAASASDDRAENGAALEDARDEAMDGDNNENPALSGTANASSLATVPSISQLASQHPKLIQFALWSTTVAMSWADSCVCNKAACLCNALIHQATSDGELLILNSSSDEAAVLLQGILQGLHVHGQHESIATTLFATAFSLYQTLRPSNLSLMNVLLQVPGISEAEISAFDNAYILIQQGSQQKTSEKRKKDAFRKLVSHVVGKNIGQMFRNNEVIRNLPRLVISRSKVAAAPLLDDASDTSSAGLCELFGPVSGATV